MYQTIIRRLEERYDADHDTQPGAPAVTWADMELLRIIVQLTQAIEALEMRVSELTDARRYSHD